MSRGPATPSVCLATTSHGRRIRRGDVERLGPNASGAARLGALRILPPARQIRPSWLYADAHIRAVVLNRYRGTVRIREGAFHLKRATARSSMTGIPPTGAENPILLTLQRHRRVQATLMDTPAPPWTYARRFCADSTRMKIASKTRFHCASEDRPSTIALPPRPRHRGPQDRLLRPRQCHGSSVRRHRRAGTPRRRRSPCPTSRSLHREMRYISRKTSPSAVKPPLPGRTAHQHVPHQSASRHDEVSKSFNKPDLRAPSAAAHFRPLSRARPASDCLATSCNRPPRSWPVHTIRLCATQARSSICMPRSCPGGCPETTPSISRPPLRGSRCNHVARGALNGRRRPHHVARRSAEVSESLRRRDFIAFAPARHFSPALSAVHRARPLRSDLHPVGTTPRSPSGPITRQEDASANLESSASCPVTLDQAYFNRPSANHGQTGANQTHRTARIGSTPLRVAPRTSQNRSRGAISLRSSPGAEFRPLSRPRIASGRLAATCAVDQRVWRARANELRATAHGDACEKRTRLVSLLGCLAIHTQHRTGHNTANPRPTDVTSGAPGCDS